MEEAYVPPPEEGFADALSEGHFDVVRAALAAHPDWLNGCLLRGNPVVPIQDAAYGGHAEMLAWLIRQGAAVDHRDDYGRTPLWHAAWQLRQGYDLAGGLNPRFVAVVRVLLAAGADPGVRDEDGCSPDEAFREVRGYGLREAAARG